MRARNTLTVLTLLVLTGVSAPAMAAEITGGSAEDRAAMQKISVKWLESYASGDLDGIMSVMHADAMVMPHNQPTSRGTEAVRNFFAGRIGRPGVEFIDNLQEIRINGDWAYVLGTFKLKIASGEADKPPYIHNGRYLVLYEKVDGEWKMLRDMDNADPVGN